jgi:hypothetical protein
MSGGFVGRIELSLIFDRRVSASLRLTLTLHLNLSGR